MKTAIEMAREADKPDETCWLAYEIDFLERFAELVRAEERKACAKVCEELQSPPDWNVVAVLWKECRSKLAEAIRARSQA